jgi:ribosome recycling factor
LRSFSVSANLQKKRKIAIPNQHAEQHRDEEAPDTSSRKKGAASPAETVDPLDMSSVLEAFVPMDAHFRAQLQGLSHGGRFNPNSLGALVVTVKSEVRADDGSGSMTHEIQDFPLSELAQVVPRSGRTISLLVNDRSYIKPIMSAVQASKDFNQQPQRSEDNDLELLLKVEMERKEDVVRRVKEATQTWRERVRSARGKQEKAIKGWQKSKTITPDLAKRAEKELQKLQDKKMKEIDDEEAKTIKALSRN